MIFNEHKVLFELSIKLFKQILVGNFEASWLLVSLTILNLMGNRFCKVWLLRHVSYVSWLLRGSYSWCCNGRCFFFEKKFADNSFRRGSAFAVKDMGFIFGDNSFFCRVPPQATAVVSTLLVDIPLAALLVTHHFLKKIHLRPTVDQTTWVTMHQIYAFLNFIYFSFEPFLSAFSSKCLLVL